MTGIICNPTDTAIWTASKLTELVRGTDQLLLEQVEPLVLRQNVVLDLCSVERIDAAGIAALISLYTTACQCGHSFTILNAAPRVTEILALVKLDLILLSHNAAQRSYGDPCLERPAA